MTKNEKWDKGNINCKWMKPVKFFSVTGSIFYFIFINIGWLHWNGTHKDDDFFYIEAK